MTLQAFSNSVLELYNVAEHAGPHIFGEEVFRIVNKLIAFDGAVLGAGLIIKATLPSISAAEAGMRVALRPGSGVDYLVPEPAASKLLEPFTALFLKGLSKPLATDYKTVYQACGSEKINRADRYPELRKFLLYGDAPSKATDARWLVLYRNGGDSFTESEAFLLEAIWHHVTRTIEMNLSHALDRLDPHHSKRAMALVSSRGIIEIASPAMIDLLTIEWQAQIARSLPLPVISALLSNGTYRGRHIEITASQKFGYLACTARRIPLIDTLAPSELNVANRYAKGMTHSQIATLLHVSPNTVRNQLAQAYQKLGVHSKIELMRALSNRQGRPN
jgi:DNA-binding CsgD family transcriptional regulator